MAYFSLAMRSVLHVSRFRESAFFLRSLSVFTPALKSAGRRYKSNGATASEQVSPRTAGFGHAIEDEYAVIRENYSGSSVVSAA